MIRKTLCLSVFISAVAIAASPAIGIVTASGHFTLDRSQVWGNATVFEGSTIETGAASSEVALRSGAKLQLAKDSRARILSGRVVMEKGIGQVSAPESFEVNAGNLRIHSDGRLRVIVGEGVQIASLTGIARVSSASGMLLAAIPAGRTMNFTPQAANGSVARTGCLMYKDNHYILQDENTQEVVELSGGENLKEQLGNRVEITRHGVHREARSQHRNVVVERRGHDAKIHRRLPQRRFQSRRANRSGCHRCLQRRRVQRRPAQNRRPLMSTRQRT